MANTGHLGHASNSYGKEQRDDVVLFDSRSTSEFSGTFQVTEFPGVIQAWGLKEGDVICLQQAWGDYEGEEFAPFSLEPGKVAMLTECHTAMPIIVEGRYRLQMTGVDPLDPPVGRVVVTFRENTTGADLSPFQMFHHCCPAPAVDELPNMDGAGAPTAAPDPTANQPVYVDTNPDGSSYVYAAGAWAELGAALSWMQAPVAP